MMPRIVRALVLLPLLSGIASAQHAAASPTVRSAPPEARQFSFLVGQFDLRVKPKAVGLAQKIHGVPKLVGSWKGWRAMDGFGIEDELRITDASGNPMALSHAVRYYDTAAHHWVSSTIDVYRGIMSTSTSVWRGNVMVATASGTGADGAPYVARTTYSDVTPTSFHFTQDRSTDGGRTWEEGVLVIDATRVAGATPHP